MFTKPCFSYRVTSCHGLQNQKQHICLCCSFFLTLWVFVIFCLQANMFILVREINRSSFSSSFYVAMTCKRVINSTSITNRKTFKEAASQKIFLYPKRKENITSVKVKPFLILLNFKYFNCFFKCLGFY